MENKYIIETKSLSKVYNLNPSKKAKLFSFFSFGLFDKSKSFYALKDINFSVEPGLSVGIIGLNGSGKSTLSNILGGVVEPTTGSVISDSIPSLIAIGAGLNNDFTGLENINYKCLMHGLSQKEIDERVDDIIEFSELGDFINQPLKNYSSGMRSRLGFSIAIHTDPDILIVDEALSVGDETFSNKCIVKIRELQKEGKTIFFVSHSTPQILNTCDKALWIHYGKLIMFDDVKNVVDSYRNFMKQYKALERPRQLNYKKSMLNTQIGNSMSEFKSSTNGISKSSLVILVPLITLLIYLVKLQIGI